MFGWFRYSAAGGCFGGAWLLASLGACKTLPNWKGSCLPGTTGSIQNAVEFEGTLPAWHHLRHAVQNTQLGLYFGGVGLAEPGFASPPVPLARRQWKCIFWMVSVLRNWGVLWRRWASGITGCIQSAPKLEGTLSPLHHWKHAKRCRI